MGPVFSALICGVQCSTSAVRGRFQRQFLLEIDEIRFGVAVMWLLRYALATFGVQQVECYYVEVSATKSLLKNLLLAFRYRTFCYRTL